MELKTNIRMGSAASLSTINHRQKRRPEDRSAIDDTWDETFGQRCADCGHKHAPHTPCRSTEGEAS